MPCLVVSSSTRPLKSETDFIKLQFKLSYSPSQYEKFFKSQLVSFKTKQNIPMRCDVISRGYNGTRLSPLITFCSHVNDANTFNESDLNILF